MRRALAVAFGLPTFVLLTLCAGSVMADVDGTILPDLVGWQEQHRSAPAGAGFLAWAPDGRSAVEASGVTPHFVLFGQYGFFPAAKLRLLNETLAPVSDLYGPGVLLRTGLFTPNGSWFVATFDVPPATPFNFGSPEFDNTTVHFGIWETSTWTMVGDQVITDYRTLAAGNASSFPMAFAISPQGDRILLWDEYGFALFDPRMELRAFPSLAPLANRTFSLSVLDARWDPRGDRVAVSLSTRVDAVGELAIVDSRANLNTLQSTVATGRVFTSLSWSPNGSLLSAKKVTYANFGGSCIWPLAPSFVAAEILDSGSLATSRVLWTANGSALPCGMPLDDVYQGFNSSAILSFHPTLGYLLSTHGGRVEVLNTTFWDPVFAANLSLPGEYPGNWVAQAAWSGSGGSFSFATAGMVNWTGAPGWQYGPIYDRALYIGAFRTPSASVVLHSQGGRADLHPGFPDSGSSVEITVDSTVRMYGAVTVTLAAPNSSVSFVFDTVNATLVQTAGASWILLADSQFTSAWNGSHGELRVTLVASWLVDHDGAWAMSAAVLLRNGSVGAATVQGALFTRLAVELTGPLVVLDAAGGVLAALEFVNRTPTLNASWSGARWVVGQQPLDPAGFTVVFRANGSIQSSAPLAGVGSGGVSALMALAPGPVVLRLGLSHASGHAVDETTLNLTVLADGAGPWITILSPAMDQWLANSSVVVRFEAADPESGVWTSGAVAVALDLDGVTLFDVQAATVSGGTDGAAAATFEALVSLPPGPSGRVRLRATAFDAVRNSLEAEIEIQLDREAASVSVDPLPSWINSSTVEIRWECVDSGVGFNLTFLIADFSPEPGSSSILVDGFALAGGGSRMSASGTIRPTEGTLGAFRVGCEDSLGNAGLGEVVRLNVDTTAPELVGRSPADGTVLVGRDQNLTALVRDNVSGTSEGSVVCAASTDGGVNYASGSAAQVRELSNGTVEVTCRAQLSEGTDNRIRFGLSDRAGNLAVFGPFALRVNVPPTSEITAPTHGSVVTTFEFRASITLAAVVADADDDVVSVEWFDLDGGDRLAAGANATATLAVGAHRVQLRITDSAGHVVIREVTVTVAQVRATEGGSLWLPLAAVIAAILAVLLLVALRRRRTRDEP